MALQITNEQYNALSKDNNPTVPNGDVKIINKNGKDYLCVNVPGVRGHMNLSILDVRHYFETQGWKYYMSQGVFMFFTKNESFIDKFLKKFKNKQTNTNN